MDFALSDEHQMIVDTVRSFTERELFPYEDQVEKLGEVPPDLVQQINTHKDLLRGAHRWQRRRAQRSGSEPSRPLAGTVAAVQIPLASSDDIRSYVDANLARLERFVERELTFREADKYFSSTIGDTPKASALLSKPYPASSGGSSDAASTSSPSKPRIALAYSARLRRRSEVLPGFGLTRAARSMVASSDEANALIVA